MRQIPRRSAWLAVTAALLLSAPAPVMGAVPAPAVADLAARAAESGAIRVIVQVQPDHVPSGWLTPAESIQQQQAIAARQQAVAQQVAATGAAELHRFRHIPFALYQANSAGVIALGQDPRVTAMQEDVPELPELQQSAAIVGAPAAWALGADGSGQAVAVLDTGVDLAHAFFAGAGKILAEACFSSTVPQENATSLCAGGADMSLDPGAGGACPAAVSGCSHGTHVAGIAVGDDGAGPDIGIARGAALIPIQVNSRFSGGSGDYAASYPSDQIRAMEQVYDWRDTYPIAAVNLSLGGSNFSSQATCDAANTARKAAIDNLRSVGIPAVAASGNFSQRNGMTQPGCISSAISVGATTDADAVASFSNIAPFISLLAPGANIRSAALGGGLLQMSGTSMATPHVAGAWAILRQAAPAASVDDILLALQSSGTLVDDTRVGGIVTGMARINIDDALALLQDPEPEFASSPAAGAIIPLGEVFIGATSAEGVVMVSNTGTAELTLACALAGAQPERFAITACAAAVPPANATDVRVTCSPEAAGPLAATLELTTNDSDEGSVSFDLTCEGVPDVMFANGFEDG